MKMRFIDEMKIEMKRGNWCFWRLKKVKK